MTTTTFDIEFIDETKEQITEIGNWLNWAWLIRRCMSTWKNWLAIICWPNCLPRQVTCTGPKS